MFANTVAASLQKKGIHYGWVIAAVTFVTMLSTSAALGLPGVMLRPLADEFGWTIDQLSSVVRGPLRSLRAARPLRRDLHGPLRAAPRDGDRGVLHRRLAAAGDAGRRALAALPALGPGARLRQRADGTGARRHDRQPLVHGPARPRHRPARSEHGHRPIAVPAGGGVADRARRLALRGVAAVHRVPGGGRADPALHAGRPAAVGLRAFGEPESAAAAAPGLAAR